MKSRKTDMRYHFRTRVIVNILYSALVACLVEVFLVTNLDMVARYAKEAQWNNALMGMIYESDLVIVIGYVLLGIMIFSMTFLLLQERSAVYIGRISDAIRNISEGDLNTAVEVEGDDEFSSMAANLNKMVEDIRQLMDKEREAERTKNELITNVAHDLRTPLTSIINYVDLIKRQHIQNEAVTEYLNILDQKSQRLKTLTEDLLEASRKLTDCTFTARLAGAIHFTEIKGSLTYTL